MTRGASAASAIPAVGLAGGLIGRSFRLSQRIERKSNCVFGGVLFGPPLVFRRFEHR
jgi:hypothetical protein